MEIKQFCKRYGSMWNAPSDRDYYGEDEHSRCPYCGDPEENGEICEACIVEEPPAFQWDAP